MAPLVRTGGSRHTGLAALPHRNIQYDDRLLVKPTKSAISYMPTVTYEIPYENAKEMLLVEEVDNKDFLTGLFDVMYDELPTPKPKKKK